MAGTVADLMQVMFDFASRRQGCENKIKGIAPMTMPELTLALMVLLLTPGPTNTLMLLAGTERGLNRALLLIPVEIAAYLAVIAPLALLSHVLADQLATIRPAVATAAGLWVAWLALQMWRAAPEATATETVTARRLAVTTLLNPKGLIMGLVLLPAAGASAAAFGLLATCIALVAAFWAFLGCCLPGREDGAGFPPLLRRLAACWLAGLSVFIVAGGLAS